MSSKLRLAWFTDLNPRRWQEEGAPFGYDWRDRDFYLDAARTLERGRFDLMIGADVYSLEEFEASKDMAVRLGDTYGHMHPALVFAAMSTVTNTLGFVSTLSTVVYPPFLLAREMATLNNLSAGRAGWNIVTAIGSRVAQNLGGDVLPGREDRYEMAQEFVDVVRKLWRSWEPDAIIKDIEADIFADPAKIHEINHKGKYYNVRGPLNTPPGPVEPLIMQAGGSPTGQAFAARNADLVISHSNTVSGMKKFCSQIKDLAAARGRDRDSVKVLFTFKPIIGQTNEEAHERRNRLIAYGEKRIGSGIITVQGKSGLDLRDMPLDEPLSEEAVLNAGAVAGFYYQHYAGDEKPTLRQVLGREAMKESYPLVGTADDIAAQLVELKEEVGFDGIAIREALSPLRTAEIVDLLVPAMVRRGLIRDSFRHKTLRENFFDEDA